MSEIPSIDARALAIKRYSGLINETNEPVDAEAAVTYWRERWAATAAVCTRVNTSVNTFTQENQVR